ncbi:hypothetical protein BaRGS_00040524 [Batillaria attramentaria]|uniref:G-protein coupled receptors family 1 profile domain-containing protein n=1 Tax=Batillaria attramentaria TaxID=370345 RepID=A0ABD0IZR6_9CAEN
MKPSSMMIVSPITLLLGSFGNIVMLVLLHRLKFHNRAFMVLLNSLAVSDLLQLYLVLLPAWLVVCFDVKLYDDNSLVCYALKWMYFNTSTTSPWYLAVMAAYRAALIVCPIRMKTACTTYTAVGVVAGIAAVAMAGHAIVLFLEANCTENAVHWHSYGLMAHLNFVLRFALPFLVLFVSNVLLVKYVWVRFKFKKENRNCKLPSKEEEATRDTILLGYDSCLCHILCIGVTVGCA